jgi:hypothetical protein
MVILHFDREWDAWAFAVANGLPDPCAGCTSRKWTNRPPEVKPTQERMF